MKTIPELLDLAKEKQNLTSDRKLGLALGIANTAPYRTRGQIPNDETAIKLAKLCGLPAEQVLITCHLAKAQSGDVHDVWNKVLKMAANACVVLVLAASALSFPAASVADDVHSESRHFIHYATFIIALVWLLLYSTPFIRE